MKLFLRLFSTVSALRAPRPLINCNVDVYDSDQSQVVFKTLPYGITEHWFEQKLDHFGKDERTFKLRYWLSDRHYQPGGPVVALLGGETSGLNRIEFLDTGIVDILTKSTQGLGVIVEHRYYGASIPVEDFSSRNLQWLTTAQALEDNIYFSLHAELGYNATADRVPWIWYGGSYAGAQAAFLAQRDEVHGAIASSAVVHAQTSFWEYYEPIKVNMPPACSQALIAAVEYIDTTLMLGGEIKGLFALEELDNQDFVNVLAIPLGHWQEQQWNEHTNEFLGFCSALLRNIRQDESSAISLQKTIINYADYIKANVTSRYSDFSAMNDKVDLRQTWRLWLYQVCTEWGYHMPAPPAHIPTIISRLLDLEYVSSLCRTAFDNIPEWPNTDKVNAYGDFSLTAKRLMYVDGTADPWLYATPHSPYAPRRGDSIDHPFKFIDGGFHHSDEYGARHEPEQIARVHQEQIEIVQKWLSEYTPQPSLEHEQLP